MAVALETAVNPAGSSLIRTPTFEIYHGKTSIQIQRPERPRGRDKPWIGPLRDRREATAGITASFGRGDRPRLRRFS
jgi:hypothetical protein